MTSPHFLLAAMLPLTIFELPLQLPDIQLAMYWHERTHNSVAHQWFRQAVRDALPGDLKQPGVMLRVASR